MGKLVLVDKGITDRILCFMEQLGIYHYNVDYHTLRKMYAAPMSNEYGEAEISTAFDKKLLNVAIDLIENRLKRGELTILTNLDLETVKLKRFIDLANRMRMELLVVTEKKSNFKGSGKVKIVSPEEFVPEMKMKVLNFNKYKKVHHFGDIQGCNQPLEVYFQEGIKEDEAYVFLGDLLDRGAENDKVLEFVLKNMDRENFYFIFGNHEGHLLKWANNKRSNSIEFEEKTKKQLEAAEISKTETKKLLSKMKYNMFYERNGIYVLGSHGGTNFLPIVPEVISNNQWVWGCFGDVDEQFQEWADRNRNCVYQVHGHSNPNQNRINLHSNSFNLEGKVEDNGILRVVTLNDEGFEMNYVERTL